MYPEVLMAGRRHSLSLAWSSGCRNDRVLNVYGLIYWPIFTLISFLGLTESAYAERSGALDVRIPSYDGDGRLHWELQAEEVELLGDKKYLAKEPRMRMLESNRPVSEARSVSGTFDLGNGSAYGADRLIVDSEGFEAEGREWTFQEIQKGARSRLAFTDDARVGFTHELGTLFAAGPSVPVIENSRVSPKGGHRKKEPSKNRKFPTLAYAKKFELIDLGKGRHKFLLEKEVLLEIEFSEDNSSEIQLATISCDRAVVDLGPEDNSSIQAIGKILRIHAEGEVRMKQPGRFCSAQKFHWQAAGGEVVLNGEAVVLDDQWGEASGERIILRKEDGRAEVVGGEKGRSRLALPSLPAFTFPKFPGSSK